MRLHGGVRVVGGGGLGWGVLNACHSYLHEECACFRTKGEEGRLTVLPEASDVFYY